MMSDKEFENKELSDMFQVAREAAELPSRALMARVEADAMATQARFDTSRARPAFWRDLFRTLGGWPSMAGLATATVAGVWLGAFPPDFLPSAADAYLGLSDAGYLIDAAPGLGFDLGEETL